MRTAKLRLLIIFASYALSYFLAVYFGYIYAIFTSDSLGGSFIPSDAAQWIVGLPLALIGFVIFLLHTVGGKNVWWWAGISLIPAILFEVFLDPFHIYIPALVGLIAWGLGTLANKTLTKLAPQFMAKMGK